MNQQKYYCKECGEEISEYTNSSNRGMCYSCSQNAYYSDLADRLKENEEIETCFEDDIICPYCGYRIQDDECYYEREGYGEDECPECGKAFYFQAHIQITYSTTRKEDKQ